jgi:ADP-ribose pyrophosphatase
VGFEATEMRKVASFYLAPGWATEFMHGFIATGLKPKTAQGDEDEDIEIVALRPEEALTAIHSGEIIDCKSVALIALWLWEQRTRP